jgi:hypothetical protein
MQPDDLVPDPRVAQEMGGVRLITLWRWTNHPTLGFPPAIKINGRNYRKRSELEAFKQRMASSKKEVV